MYVRLYAYYDAEAGKICLLLLIVYAQVNGGFDGSILFFDKIRTILHANQITHQRVSGDSGHTKSILFFFCTHIPMTISVICA